MDLSVRNGPLSHASPTGKAKKWKTMWAMFEEPSVQLGRTHATHTQLNHHPSRKKRQLSDTDRRCLEQNEPLRVTWQASWRRKSWLWVALAGFLAEGHWDLEG